MQGTDLMSRDTSPGESGALSSASGKPREQRQGVGQAQPRRKFLRRGCRRWASGHSSPSCALGPTERSFRRIWVRRLRLPSEQLMPPGLP